MAWRCALLSILVAGAVGLPAAAQIVAVDKADPYLWLEEVNGARAMAWVEAANKASLAVLEGDAHYPGVYAEALRLAEAKDRIPYPRFIGAMVYNFWQDAEHVHGVWRRTTLDGYASAAPPWETVLDLDALAKTDRINWVWKGATCRQPDDRRCLIQLSDGGEDAVSVREFDLETKAFVPGGFDLPRSKQDLDWLDPDTLIVARDWGAGTMTASGYPFVVKTIKRGQALAEAREIFRGEAGDVGVSPSTMTDGDGGRVTLINRALSFFESQTLQVTAAGVARLTLPLKADVHGLVRGALVIKLNQAWEIGGAHFQAGALVAAKPEALLADSARPGAALLFAPNPRQSVDDVAVTQGRVVATVLDNVRGRLYAFAPGRDGWTARPIPVPDNLAVGLVSASDRDNRVFVSLTGFLTPTTVSLADAADGALTPLKALPAKFEANRDVVEQYEAVSKDGTRVPYFVVRPKDLTFDGQAPTLLYAYGGFQASELPNYSAGLGKLWLERGGVYVVANIRGGGEFGPAWHEAGLKTERQRIYDDFAAVGQDLIARKVTSPRRLGIRGGSNGGLLMGVEFNQHPELWNAVIIDVPLLDMLRFEQIAAGASWVGEYGSVSVPAERAFLASISPYANLKQGGAYPEPFIFTTTKDDRVGPVHARKFAARMQEYGLPFLYYENTEGGHAAGSNLRESAREQALEMTYLIRKLVD